MFLSYCVSPSHQLPHQCQSQGSVAIVQVLPADANEGELGCFTKFHGIITILQLEAQANSCRKKEAKTPE